MEIKTLKLSGKKGFSLLAGINRNIIPSHVTKLANSVDAMGIIRPVVVSTFNFLDGKDVTYIIDGQHLYTACLRLNLDIPYVEIKINTVEELVEKIALLNASSKSWTLQDYIQSWKIVNKDYVVLESLYQRYDIELCQVAQILHYGCVQQPRTGGGGISKVIKSGNLTVKNLKDGQVMLDQVTDALKTVPRMDRASNAAFIHSFSMFTLTKGYNHLRTIKFLKENKSRLTFATQDPEEFNKLFYSMYEKN